jgi:hypothetical protein
LISQVRPSRSNVFRPGSLSTNVFQITALGICTTSPIRFSAAFSSQRAGGDVHAIAEDTILIADDIARVDADAHGHLRLLAQVALDGDRSGHGIDSAVEDAERAIAVVLEEPAAMLGDARFERCALAIAAGHCLPLVFLHERGVADHVAEDDGTEPAGRLPYSGFVAHRSAASLPISPATRSISAGVL